MVRWGGRGSLLSKCHTTQCPCCETMFDKEELANDYIPTGGSAIEMADWEIESANSTADSPKVGAWVRVFRDNKLTAEKHYFETV